MESDEFYRRSLESYLTAAFDAGAEGAGDEVLHGLADDHGVHVDDVTWKRGVKALQAGAAWAAG